MSETTYNVDSKKFNSYNFPVVKLYLPFITSLNVKFEIIIVYTN